MAELHSIWQKTLIKGRVRAFIRPKLFITSDQPAKGKKTSVKIKLN